MGYKIVQLMPIQSKLEAVYEDGGKEYYKPVIALGLKADGDVVMLIPDEDGNVYEIDEPINFKRVDMS